MDYKQLLAWQVAMDLCEATYRLTDDFPRREVFGLTSQLRKSAVSVPSNIAEGEVASQIEEVRRILNGYIAWARKH
jgi:four helix bundle protein